MVQRSRSSEQTQHYRRSKKADKNNFCWNNEGTRARLGKGLAFGDTFGQVMEVIIIATFKVMTIIVILSWYAYMCSQHFRYILTATQ
jgi:hypothetical protein